MKVCMGLSGGLDSSTLLAILVDNDEDVLCLGFEYGSKHNKYEIESAKKIAKYYNVDYKLIDLTNVGKILKSNLLLSGGEIPEGHYQQENMKLTVVPGRNLMFASILAGYAESNDCEAIALGVHQGDHEIYPDCRKEFIKALDSCIYLSTNRKVEVITPLINMDKGEIVAEGLALEVPYQLTRTCYKDQEKSCQVCGSCNERLEAFSINCVEDPIEYE